MVPTRPHAALAATAFLLLAATLAPTGSTHPVAYLAGVYTGVDVTPDSGGMSVVTIFDGVAPLSAGDYCQDNDLDGLCGGPNDYAGDFCAQLVLLSAINWDPAEPLQIRVHSADLATCGTLTLGTTGTLVHSP
jgi:hypothetical protein